ncbi:DUF4326 domain-containing protein [Nonomuraea angiospora]|uniref:DUF4326 domain-containing protein n=1 Tax=Nonomuraea angiospora TaxID=46172 RepID=UPI0029A3157C|nr:DUF4326 domain-containing protein [Nonomuraea angiospora]MDX3110809.1 DUF4326 domain-containing protein [Nonomuraea angiospora]
MEIVRMNAATTVEVQEPGPRRVKVEGDRFHGRVPEGAEYVGREFPGHRRSPFANPHSLSEKGCRVCGGRVHQRSQVIELYLGHLREHPELVERARRELRGKDLACWCDPDQECHADALLAVVAGAEP